MLEYKTKTIYVCPAVHILPRFKSPMLAAHKYMW